MVHFCLSLTNTWTLCLVRKFHNYGLKKGQHQHPQKTVIHRILNHNNQVPWCSVMQKFSTFKQKIKQQQTLKQQHSNKKLQIPYAIIICIGYYQQLMAWASSNITARKWWTYVFDFSAFLNCGLRMDSGEASTISMPPTNTPKQNFIALTNIQSNNN